jgi:hypothetical protein
MLLYLGEDRKASTLVTGNIWKINGAPAPFILRRREAASKDDSSGCVNASKQPTG